MNVLLDILDDIAWIHESLAVNHTGEAKTSMSELADRLENMTGCDFGDPRAMAQIVRDSRQAFVYGTETNRIDAVTALTTMSRRLWVLAKSPANHRI